MYGYYCYDNEVDGTLTCYYVDQVCTYYPDGSVNCVPRASLVPWGTSVANLIFMIFLVVAFYLVFVKQG
jgi:hypothetical protein